MHMLVNLYFLFDITSFESLVGFFRIRIDLPSPCLQFFFVIIIPVYFGSSVHEFRCSAHGCKEVFRRVIAPNYIIYVPSYSSDNCSS
jgi:hypothetical protein